MDKTNQLLLLLSCIGHDLNHPGLANTYFAKSRHSLAKATNELSILEHFHTSHLLAILAETELLAHFTPANYATFTGKMVEVILSTDMAVHNKLMKSHVFDDWCKDHLSADQILKLMKLLVHTCDISNAAQQFNKFKQWGLRISQEFDDCFVAETDLSARLGTEKAYGCAPPLPFLKWSNYKGFCQGQINFVSKSKQIVLIF